MSIRRFVLHTGQRRARLGQDSADCGDIAAGRSGRREPSPAGSVPWPVDAHRQDLNAARQWLYGDLARRYPHPMPEVLDPAYAALLDLIDRTAAAARVIDGELRRADSIRTRPGGPTNVPA